MTINKTQVIQNAQAYTAKGQIDKAIEEWQKLISESPNDGNIYNTIGDLYLRLKKNKQASDAFLKAGSAFQGAGFALKAIAVYKKVLKIDPERYEIHMRLGDVNAERGLKSNAIEDYLTAAKHYTQENKVKQALDVYGKIANLDPTNIGIRLKLAEMCLKEGFEEQAVNEYIHVVKIYAESGQKQKAEAIHEKILKLDPKNEKARVALGMIAPSQETSGPQDLLAKAEEAMAQEIYDQAEQYLRQLSSADPSNPVYQEKLGCLFLKKGQYFMALAPLKAAALSYLQQGETARAAKLMRDYQEGGADQMEVHQILAVCHEKEGDPGKAISEYARVIDAHIAVGTLDQAQTLFEKIKEIDPGHSEVKRLQPKFQYNEPELATPFQATELVAPESPEPESVLVEDLKAAPVVDDANIRNLLTEAEIYVKYGLVVKAIEQLQQVLAMAPDNIQAHQQLKEIYKADGQKEKAIDACLRLALVYKKLGDTEAYGVVVQEARDLDPNHPRLKEETDLAQLLESDRMKAILKEGGIGEGPVSPQVDEVVLSSIEAMEAGDSMQETGVGDPASSLKADEPHTEPAKPLQVEPEMPGLEIKIRKPTRRRSLLSEEISKVGETAETDRSVTEGTVPEPADPSGRTVPPSTEEPFRPGSGGELSFSIERPAVEEGGFVDLAGMVEEEVSKASQPSPPKEKGRDAGLRSVISAFHQKEAGAPAEEIDYETHYNLGIAYCEMGLIDEAISEFKLSGESQDRFIDSRSMISACLRKKNEMKEAVRPLIEALAYPGGGPSERLWLSYDLASLYEQTGRLEEALDLYERIYRQDRNFRDVGARLEMLRSSLKNTAPQARTARKTGDQDEDVDSMLERIFGDSVPDSDKPTPDRKDPTKKKSRISYL